MSVRMNISLDEDLKTRMDRADKKDETNWSQIAAGAFEKRLAEIAARKVDQNMDDVIQRLKASKLESESEDYQAGHDAGQKWAQRDAEWKQLERLQRTIDRCGNDFGNVFYGENGGIYFFQSSVDPDQDIDRREWEEFWGEWLNSPSEPSEEFVRGFWDGAVEFFDEVKDKV